MSPTRLSQEERKALTRAALLEAAARVFLRQGFFAASVDEVASEAGFSKGAVYGHFESKEDLFLAVVEERIHQRVLAISELLDGRSGPQAQAVEAGERFMAVLSEERAWVVLTLEFWACAARNPELGPAFTERHRAFRAAVARLIAEQSDRLGITLPMPAERLASAVLALGHGITLEKLADPEQTPDELFGELVSSLFGLSPPPVGPGPRSSPSQGPTTHRGPH
jgi:AcrR family transcriptional regulator